MSKRQLQTSLRLFALSLVIFPLLMALRAAASKFDWQYFLGGFEKRTLFPTKWWEFLLGELSLWVIPMAIGIFLLKWASAKSALGANSQPLNQEEEMKTRSSHLWVTTFICVAGLLFMGISWGEYKAGVETGYEQMSLLISLGYGGPYPTTEELRIQGLFEFSVHAVAGIALIIFSSKLARVASRNGGI
jgi:hypothetical protein